MPEQLQKNFLIDIQQKLYEKETLQGNLAVYQTSSFGIILAINDQIVFSESDGFFYYEMMAHPALFTHPRPKLVAILGNSLGILQEVLKHSSITQVDCIIENTHLEETISKYFTHLYQEKNDQRVVYHYKKLDDWLNEAQSSTYDIVIQSNFSQDCMKDTFKRYHQLLKEDGILVQPCQSSLLQLNTLKLILQTIQHAGFNDWQTLNFPQPSYPSGFRTVMMATKHAVFKRVREKDVFNRAFSTRYYNFDTHKAALALPEFMREELGKG